VEQGSNRGKRKLVDMDGYNYTVKVHLIKNIDVDRSFDVPEACLRRFRRKFKEDNRNSKRRYRLSSLNFRRLFS